MKKKHNRHPFFSYISFIAFVFLNFYIPGISSSRIVSLGSIEIYNTHEWLPTEPTVYFRCQNENKTVLPDVKKKNMVYVFKGIESWQPLTELPEEKCKRCGLYEADTIKEDDVFDEWEFCSSDFSDGKYVRFKGKEFNATFICPKCTDTADSDVTAVAPSKEENNQHVGIIVIVTISLLASAVVICGSYLIYKYWQRRKREQDQARFLKLFEEGDDIEDELDLEHL